MRLPGNARSISLPRLALDRTLSREPWRGTWGRFEAPRLAFQESALWARPDSKRPRRNTPWLIERVLHEYLRPIGLRNPAVRMLAADLD